MIFRRYAYDANAFRSTALFVILLKIDLEVECFKIVKKLKINIVV